MSKRYDLIGYCSYRDNETGKISDNFVGVLNEQDQKIKELEHRLSKCIEPKFKKGDKVWVFSKELDKVLKIKIDSMDIEIDKYVTDITYYDIDGIGYDVDCTFATEEEAKAKLRSLQK